MTIMYHDGNRRLQDQFDSRRISDRLEEKLTRTAFTADDKAFLTDLEESFKQKVDEMFQSCAPGRKTAWKRSRT